MRLTKEFEFFPKIRPENSCEANPNDKNRPISSQILIVDRCFVEEEAGRAQIGWRNIFPVVTVNQ